LLTFHFVAIGWLFFQLSSPTRAWTTLLRLFGAA
jgi:D-alanyl-lipoteichoic acid acyltransferase DltB (MBOAT superfamily)